MDENTQGVRGRIYEVINKARNIRWTINVQLRWWRSRRRWRLWCCCKIICMINVEQNVKICFYSYFLYGFVSVSVSWMDKIDVSQTCNNQVWGRILQNLHPFHQSEDVSRELLLVLYHIIYIILLLFQDDFDRYQPAMLPRQNSFLSSFTAHFYAFNQQSRESREGSNTLPRVKWMC